MSEFTASPTGSPAPFPPRPPFPRPQGFDTDAEERVLRVLFFWGVIIFCVMFCFAAARRAFVEQEVVTSTQQEAQAMQQRSRREEKELRKKFIKENLKGTTWKSYRGEQSIAEDLGTLSLRSLVENKVSKSLKAFATSSGNQEANKGIEISQKDPEVGMVDVDLDEESGFFGDKPGCSICLSAFEDHDEVCTADKAACSHVYHKDCMEGWLMRRDDCPFCRETFLEFPTPQEVSR